jgi:molybdate transport system substrate-binding protein
MRTGALWLAVGSLAAAIGVSGVQAADIKVLCSNGLREVMLALAPEFERVSGHKLNFSFGLAAAFKQKIEAGEPFDVAVLTPALLDDVVKQGKVAGDHRAIIARAGNGLAIRAGAARPDIGTVEAFKTTLINAKSIAYAKPGQSGIYFVGLIDRLGIADAIKTKSRAEANGVEVGAAVARGDAELGVLPISELLPMKGVELLGPFPAEVQGYVVMEAGVGAAAHDQAAAAALVKFLKSPEHFPVIKQKGMEPG